ncbi:MAG: c-type cytochrome [Ginsengibacter sp.]
MKKTSIVFSVLMVLVIFIFSRCSDEGEKTGAANEPTDSTVAANYGGFDSQVAWGAHLVSIAGCNDCHTPKKMTAMGPVNDSSMLLSGHPAGMPLPVVDRKDMESKGIFLSQTLTYWIGPWGISYAPNLTSDSTGIGAWNEDQFINCLRKGKWKGLDDARPLLPPMPWQDIGQMTNEELKALFAYLKSTHPIRNIVPAPQPPVTAQKM